MSPPFRLRFVADGRKRLLEGEKLRRRTDAEVARDAAYAESLRAAGPFRRLVLRIGRAIDRTRAETESAPEDALY